MKKTFRFLSLTGKKAVALLVLTLVLVITAVDVTLAILITKTDTFENIFSPPVIRLSLEGIDDIVNTGDVPVYVRALAVANWVSVEDEHTILAETPKAGVDFEIKFEKEDWFYAEADGFYYYKKALNPKDGIALFTSAVQKVEKSGYELKIEILSSGIQAYPGSAVEEAWPTVRVMEDGTLIEATEVAR